MTWVKLDDGFFNHRKARKAGKDGRELHLAAICHAGAQLTDGRIEPEDIVPLAATVDVQRPAAIVERLVALGLWEQEGDGFRIHDYLDYNTRADKVRDRREADRIRKGSGRKDARNPDERPDRNPGGSPDGSLADRARAGARDRSPTDTEHPPNPRAASNGAGQASGEALDVDDDAAATLATGALMRVARNAFAQAESAGTQIANPRGFMAHKLREAHAEFGEKAHRLASEYPGLSCAELGDGLTNPSYLRIVLASHDRAAEA